MHTALVLEDHPHAQDWLAEALAQSFEGIRVERAADCAEARRILHRNRPDLALVDLELPDGSGVDIVAEIGRTQPACMTIVASIFDDDEHVFSALRAGAQGYLLKEQSVDELADMLRRITEGHPPISPAIARRLLSHFRAPANAPEVPLTARENTVLTGLARGHTLPEVAQQLGISRHTVSGYVKDIYRKLDIRSRAEATLEAARRGLIER
jgi:DNA-binding NarL/FixJ family response regulator